MTDVSAGEVGGIFAGIMAVLGVVGAGFKWAFGTWATREKMIDESVEKHVARLEARVSDAEQRLDVSRKLALAAAERAERAESILRHVVHAFQLISGEMSRRSPKSAVLHEAQQIFDMAFKLPTGTPDAIADLMNEMHERTKGPAE